jgi:aryl-alcohol dehydrogenase-like predicted oxidoreductase
VRVDLTPGYSISRVIKGGWQLALGHSNVPPREEAHHDMAAYVDAGLTTFDCADIYTGVEELIGSFTPKPNQSVQVHTKYVPDLATLETVDFAVTRAIIERSRRRLQRVSLDLVQFHWWDYSVDRYVETALGLERLREEGALRQIGVTNFDTPHLKQLLDAGVRVLSHQVQYSLLDRRPAATMAALCAERNIHFLCYGSVLGGFLSERWLGVREPKGQLENRSLTKYKLIIDEALGWEGFQALLESLRAIALRHETSIGAIGIAWVLRQPLVAAAIVGARNASHLEETLKALRVHLEPEDLLVLDSACGPGISGDVYELERDRGGPHGRIMKYDLNR